MQQGARTTLPCHRGRQLGVCLSRRLHESHGSLLHRQPVYAGMPSLHDALEKLAIQHGTWVVRDPLAINQSSVCVSVCPCASVSVYLCICLSVSVRACRIGHRFAMPATARRRLVHCCADRLTCVRIQLDELSTLKVACGFFGHHQASWVKKTSDRYQVCALWGRSPRAAPNENPARSAPGRGGAARNAARSIIFESRGRSRSPG